MLSIFLKFFFSNSIGRPQIAGLGSFPKKIAHTLTLSTDADSRSNTKFEEVAWFIYFFFLAPFYWHLGNIKSPEWDNKPNRGYLTLSQVKQSQRTNHQSLYSNISNSGLKILTWHITPKGRRRRISSEWAYLTKVYKD